MKLDPSLAGKGLKLIILLLNNSDNGVRKSAS